jgi:hypothetical protein
LKIINPGRPEILPGKAYANVPLAKYPFTLRIGFANPSALCITQEAIASLRAAGFVSPPLAQASLARWGKNKTHQRSDGFLVARRGLLGTSCLVIRKILFLLPDEDSNLDKQNQNLSYYHYTIGQ